jgi:hypothetical protein
VSVLDQHTLERWMSGAQVSGVGFALNEPVVVTAGLHAGTLGTVVALVSLQPESLYTVKLGPGLNAVHVPESALRGA